MLRQRARLLPSSEGAEEHLSKADENLDVALRSFTIIGITFEILPELMAELQQGIQSYKEGPLSPPPRPTWKTAIKPNGAASAAALTASPPSCLPACLPASPSLHPSPKKAELSCSPCFPPFLTLFSLSSPNQAVTIHTIKVTDGRQGRVQEGEKERRSD